MAKTRGKRKSTKRNSSSTTVLSYVLVKSPLNTTTITATHESLLSVHKKLQLHLTGEKLLSKFHIRKLKQILSRMHCPSYREQGYLEVANTLLNHICSNTLILDSPTAVVGKTLSGTVSENNELSINEPTSTELSISDATNTTNPPVEIIDLTQVKENESLSPQVIKLRYNNSQADMGSLSFPLELLTNTNFQDTPKSPNSGSPEEHIDNSLQSDIRNLEIASQNINYGSSNNTPDKSIFEAAGHESFANGNYFHLSNYSNIPAATVKASRNTPFNQINFCSNECSAISFSNETSIRPESSGTISYSIQNSSKLLEEPIWKKPNMSTVFYKSSTSKFQNALSLSEKDIQSVSSVRSQISDYEILSEGSIWREENFKKFRATEYNNNDSFLPEAISVTSDTTNIDANCCATETGNKLLPLTGESFGAYYVEPTQNFNKNLIEIGENDNIERESQNRSFGKKGIDCRNCQELDFHENKKCPMSSSFNELKITSLLENSTINETEEIIINETQNINSENTVFKKNISPFKNRTQSNSFLNYKLSGKSSRRLSVCSQNSATIEFNCGGETSVSIQEKIQSENFCLINGTIPKTMDCLSPSTTESIDAVKTKAIEDKIIRRRKKYEAKWKDMPINERVSAKFMDRFHVNIFEDPVKSLTEIHYKPNYNPFYFPKLTKKEICEQLKESWTTAKIMDEALTKVVKEYIEKCQTVMPFNMPTESTIGDLDLSDLSDEDNSKNTKWLQDYFQRSKPIVSSFLDGMFKERKNSKTYSEKKRELYELQEKDDEMEALLRRYGDFDWLKK